MQRFRFGFAIIAFLSSFIVCPSTIQADELPREAMEQEFIRVEIKGKLNSQVFAIGGETTGVQITAGDITWELDFGEANHLRRRADALHNKAVIVRGTLSAKRGVEIPIRYIVSVETLAASGRTGSE